MKKSKKDKMMVIKLKGGYKPTELDDAHKHFQEIKRGTGVIIPAKGKGSYSRKKFVIKHDLDR